MIGQICETRMGVIIHLIIGVIIQPSSLMIRCVHATSLLSRSENDGGESFVHDHGQRWRVSVNEHCMYPCVCFNGCRSE